MTYLCKPGPGVRAPSEAALVLLGERLAACAGVTDVLDLKRPFLIAYIPTERGEGWLARNGTRWLRVWREHKTCDYVLDLGDAATRGVLWARAKAIHADPLLTVAPLLAPALEDVTWRVAGALSQIFLQADTEEELLVLTLEAAEPPEAS